MLLWFSYSERIKSEVMNQNYNNSVFIFVFVSIFIKELYTFICKLLSNVLSFQLELLLTFLVGKV